MGGTHIVFLAETEELADLGGTLGTKTLGVDGVGKAGELGVALLDDGEGKDSKVGGDDAAADGLALALTSAAGAVAGVAVGEEQANTGRVHDTLLHGEALLVVAAGDLEDVALELVANGVAGDFLTHAAVHEDAELALILNIDELLRAVGRVGDVQLHLVGSTVYWPLGGSKSLGREEMVACSWKVLTQIACQAPLWVRDSVWRRERPRGGLCFGLRQHT